MKKKIIKSLKAAAVILLLFIAWAIWETLSPVKFNKPSGALPVGTLGVEVTDSSRSEDALPGQQRRRRLLLQFWYPAEKKEGLKRMDYHPNAGVFLSDVKKLFPDIPQLLLKRLAHAKTNSYMNAPVSKAENKYPVIVFSHGMDGMRFLNTYQMEELASHGYIVVSIEHTFSATGTVFQDGSRGGITPYELMEDEKFANAMVDKWSADQMFAISYIEKINQDPGNFFYRKLDTARIGILGFSFGGCVSTNTLVLDKRIKAGVNLDGFYYGNNYEKGFQQPFMELRSQPASPEKVTDAELRLSHLSRERWKYVWFDEWNKRLEAYTKYVKNSTYSYNVNGADHFSFCDLQLMAPFPSLLSPKTARIHKLTNQYCIAFFDQELKGVKSSLLAQYKKLLK
jgi:predicted dienelactone hydrolase